MGFHNTQVSLACPDAPVPSLPRGQLLLGRGWSARQTGRWGRPPGLMPSALPFSGLCLALYKGPETAVPCHGAQTGPYHPRGLGALPGGERRLASWVWHLAGGWQEPGPEGEQGADLPHCRGAVLVCPLACPTAGQPPGPELNSVAGTELPGVKGEQRTWVPLPGAWPGSVPPFPAWTLTLCLPLFPYLSLS